MMTKTTQAPQRQDIEALLPWHAAGTLSRRDAERVEAALANDNELARQYAMVREELGETIRLNETLGAPSARAMERLMTAIEAEGATARKPRFSFNIGAWISGQVAQLSPRTLGWSATAAAFAIMLQAGLIAGLYVHTPETDVHTPGPSLASTTKRIEGTEAWVRFKPTATAAEITKFLDTNAAKLVDGPQAGDFFTVRLSDTKLGKEDLDRIVKRMREDDKLVRSVSPKSE